MAITRWYIPTNTANLGMIIAQGLITDRQGFSKHYADVLNQQPEGYIPIYSDKEQSSISHALVHAISESDDLTPCLIEINLKNILDAEIVDDDNNIINLSEINDINPKNKILVSAPLPLTCINRIIIKNNELKDKFIHDTNAIYRNVPLSSLKVVVAPKGITKLFENIITKELPTGEKKDINLLNKSQVTIDYKKVYSLGGFLASLFYFAKNGKLSSSTFHQACEQEKITTSDIYDFTLINNFFYYFEDTSEDHGVTNRLFLDILEILVHEKAKDCNNLIVSFLKSDRLPDNDDFRRRSRDLADELLEFYRNTSDKPVSEVLQHAKTPKDKSSIKLILLMLFHRENLETLIETKYDIFEEEDYLLFAMLFGMRDKFIKSPKFIREYEGVQLYISHLMATYAHASINSEVKFKAPKISPTLFDMLNNLSKLKFIATASKDLGTENCYKTVMPNKEFSNSKGKSTYEGIVLPKLEIDESKFFLVMSKKNVDNNQYNKIYQQYKKS